MVLGPGRGEGEAAWLRGRVAGPAGPQSWESGREELAAWAAALGLSRLAGKGLVGKRLRGQAPRKMKMEVRRRRASPWRGCTPNEVAGLTMFNWTQNLRNIEALWRKEVRGRKAERMTRKCLKILR